MCRGRLRYGVLLFMLGGITLGLSAQESFLHFVSPFNSYKLDVKVGSAAMLSSVPTQYLDKLNNVNIPIGAPGLNISIVTRKAVTGHFEFGYQLNYIGMYGDVSQSPHVYRVHTQALENSYLFCFNLLRTDYYRPLNNCFIYYKMGAITLKNDPKIYMPDGSLQEIPGVEQQKFFFSSGVAVGTGVGIGFNRQLTPNFSVLGTLEFSRSSDSAGDIFRVNKIFYNSSNTVNQYMALSCGVSYTVDLLKSKDKSSEFFKVNSETKKRLYTAQIERKKKKWGKKSKDFWKR